MSSRSRSRTRTRARSKSKNSPEDKASTISYVLYSLRALMNEDDIRARVLTSFLKQVPDIAIGKSFSYNYELESLNAYLEEILESPTRVLFTAANLTQKVGGQTHYQTFVVDNTHKTLLMIDPSRNYATGKSVWDPKIAKKVVEPFFKEKGFTTEWLNTSAACQVKQADVFCQSWSLYLQIQAILMRGEPIDIPVGQDEKYEILLDFYKKILEDPHTCGELEYAYRAYVKDSTKGPFNKMLLKASPCAVIRTMTYKDMY